MCSSVCFSDGPSWSTKVLITALNFVIWYQRTVRIVKPLKNSRCDGQAMSVLLQMFWVRNTSKLKLMIAYMYMSMYQRIWHAWYIKSHQHYTHQVRPNWDSKPWPHDHDSTFHVTEICRHIFSSFELTYADHVSPMQSPLQNYTAITTHVFIIQDK